MTPQSRDIGRKRNRARATRRHRHDGAQAFHRQSPSVSCFGLTGPLTDRTRHFIP